MIPTNTRGLVLGTLGIAALLAAAPDAQAKPKGRKNGPQERVELAPGTADPDATGTLQVRTARRGPDAVLRVRNLEPRNEYLVVDGGSGETLGSLGTNRKGRGRFAFGAKAGAGKRAGADGTDANVPDEVLVVDAETGETVLEGDVPSDGEEPDYDYAFGWADYADDDGDSGSAMLSSFPEFGAESFYLSFLPAPAEDGEHACWCFPTYDFYADTSVGDELPLGAETAADLAGRKFRIVDAGGNAVLEGTLPEMEEFDYDLPDCPGWDEKPYPGDDDGGDNRPGHMDGGPGRDDGTNTRHRRANALPNGGMRDDPSGGDGSGGGDGGDDDGGDEPADYRLEIEGDDGEFVDVGALNSWDWCDDWYWIAYPEEDWGFWEGEWDWEWDSAWDAGYEWDWSSDGGDWSNALGLVR